MDELAKLKNEVLQLKAKTNTVGDSASAYQQTLDLGSVPTDYNITYRWDVYVQPLANADDAVFTCVASGGYMLQQSGSMWTPFIYPYYPMVDVMDPYHFMIPIFYYNPDYVRTYGDFGVQIVSNVPFIVTRKERTSIYMGYDF